MLIIGDVHRKIQAFHRLMKKSNPDRSIQVGDFGFKDDHEWFLKNFDPDKHKINFGNHDDYTFLNHPHSLGNFSFVTDEIMTIRGAKSKDAALRYENIDWWRNEEMSYEEMGNAVIQYSIKKPKIVISHNCPFDVAQSLFNLDAMEDKTLTGQGLQTMFEEHQPDMWIFGHYHRSKNETINGTKFICLAELEPMLI